MGGPAGGGDLRSGGSTRRSRLTGVQPGSEAEHPLLDVRRGEGSAVELGHDGAVLRVVVGDDGRGGADVDAGTGMRGVMRRLGAFDGTMSVSSPDGGPTIVTLEVPCRLSDSSSPRTTPSSAPA